MMIKEADDDDKGGGEGWRMWRSMEEDYDEEYGGGG